jgi:dihydrofolate reductase
VRKVVVNNNLTLDGVMQAPARPDEDTRGGFQRGGWATRYFDPMMFEGRPGAGATGPGAMLFGRRTWQDFYEVWPKRTDNPFTPLLNAATKYVASTTLTEPLVWANSVLLAGDAAGAVAKLKAEPGPDLIVLGSGELLQTLMRHGLVDEYRLLIHPLVLGSGQRLFRDGGAFAALELVDTRTTRTGVVIATYRPER